MRSFCSDTSTSSYAGLKTRPVVLRVGRNNDHSTPDAAGEYNVQVVTMTGGACRTWEDKIDDEGHNHKIIRIVA